MNNILTAIFHLKNKEPSIKTRHEVYLKSDGTGCAVGAMNERGINRLCYHLT